MNRDEFDVIWERLAKDGCCDDLGGCEYERVSDLLLNGLAHLSSRIVFARRASCP